MMKMGAIFHGLLLFYFISGLRTVISQDCSTFPIDTPINFDETAKNGSVIYTSNYTNTTTQDWTLETGSSFILLTFENGTYRMILQKESDYDVDPCQVGGTEYQETLYCTPSGQPPVRKDIYFNVNPVNEFPPVTEGNREVSITEGDLSGPKYVDDLQTGITDKDCPKETFTYSITAVPGETDASSYFMVNETLGFLYQIKSFDHEQTSIQCGVLKQFGEFNLIIQNDPFNVTENIRVRFEDVDDTPPVFVLPNCNTTCFNCPRSNITTVVNYMDQGMIQIAQIKAVDPDTTSPNITYYFTVSPSKYEDIISLDNGRLYLVESFANFSNSEETSDFEVKVMIKAENRLGIMSDNFTVFLNVNVPVTTTPEPTTESTTAPPTTPEDITTHTTTTPSTISTPPVTIPTTTPAPTTTPSVKNPDPGKSSDTNVLVIVLPIIGVLLLIILCIVIYKVRTGQPQVKYRLREDNMNQMAGSGEMKKQEFTTEVENPAYVNENVVGSGEMKKREFTTEAENPAYVNENGNV